MSMSLALALAVTIGSVVGVLADPSWLPSFRWLLAACGVLAFVSAARQWTQLVWPLTIASVASACALLAAGAHDAALHPPLRALLEERVGGFAIESVAAGRTDAPILVEGTLMVDAALTEAGAVLRLQVERAWVGPCPEPAPGGVSLTVSGTPAASAVGEWRAGRRIRAPALLRRPARYLNAGVPDQERLLARRGTTLVGSVKSGALIEVVAAGSWFDETAASIRTAVRTAMTKHVGVRDPQSAAVATAILIGDRGALDPDVERRLQEAGTYHVIAISGGNIAILAALILGALWWAGIRGGWAAGGAVALLACYASIAGGGPSVTRATVMAGIYLSLRVIDQRTAPTHAIALTAALVLLVTPLAVADVGFWLTFGATVAIVAGTASTPWVSRRGPWLRAPLLLIAASICVEAVLMPVGALVFQRVTLAGLGLNLIAVPCMAIVQVASMVVAAADVFHLQRLAGLAGWVTHLSVRGLIDSGGLVDLAPWLTWRVPSPPVGLIAAYYATLVLWLTSRINHEGLEGREGQFWKTKGRSLVSLCASWLALVLFVWIAVAPQTLARVKGDGQLHLTMMDVGQGDAMLVTLPNGRTLMLDTGGVSLRGDFDIGDRVLGPALRSRGIGRLDYLAVTHGDPDHIGGAIALARDFTPSEVWAGTFVANHEPTMRLQLTASRQRAAWRWLQKGDRLELDGVELRVHHPPPPDWERQKVRNDDSLVVELRYGTVSMLLTGDISREVELALIPTLDLLPMVVLKSPHHGSGTSSSQEFIETIKPDVVVISSGRGNPYGHPLPYVMERYRSSGAQIFRTDQEGQIELTTDGHTLEVNTFTGRRSKRR